jgi:predicted NUDIX family phosphoesterase
MAHKNEIFILAMLADNIPSVKDVEGQAELLAIMIRQREVIIAQRGMLEENTAYRQLIPYVVFKHGDKIAAYRRTQKSGEGRLHGKVSVGFGGHVDLADVQVDKATKSIIDVEETMACCAAREIEEELRFTEGTKVLEKIVLDQKIVACATPVDEVHIGVIVEVELSDIGLKANEDALEVMGFKTPKEWLNEGCDFETWTELLLKYYAK